MNDIYSTLDTLRISYKKIEHSAVFTVEEANTIDRDITAGHSKNLFLKNKKGTAYYLVVVQSDKRVDLKQLANTLAESKLSFASPEKLQEYLGLTPGSVSPFGLINNTKHDVTVIIDKDLVQQEKVAFHPNINIATLVISVEDFQKFLGWAGNKIRYLSL
ncbi:MAG: prolyl-tRNA synthetase associated domain-containing protein [Patescibacteria group bacterium]